MSENFTERDFVLTKEEKAVFFQIIGLEEAYDPHVLHEAQQRTAEAMENPEELEFADCPNNPLGFMALQCEILTDEIFGNNKGNK